MKHSSCVKNGVVTFDQAKGQRDNGIKRRASVRVFKPVESLTNQLIATDRNFRALYDVAIIQAFLVMLYYVIQDTVKEGRFYFDLSIFSNGLGSVSVFIFLEFYLFTSALVVYPCLKLWEYLYDFVIPRVLASLFILLYAGYVIISGVIVCWITLSVPLPQFTTVIVSVEQLRLCMKSYSFIRENVYKVLYPWHKDDESGPAVWYAGQMSPQVGSFSQYVYFLFAPTLLYRDQYPRNVGSIKWKNALIYFIQFLTPLWYLGIIGRDLTFPSSLRIEVLVQCYCNSLLCAFFGYFLIHTSIIHGYMNLTSELLRFADREFYSDWWTSTSFSTYYRRWNTIVHDWIRAYLYRDMKSVFGSTLPAVFSTILVSAFIHEYLIALALRFASPVLLLEFAGLGVMFYLIKPPSQAESRLSNFLVLLCLSIGGANLIFYYQVEIAARLYCPKKLNVITFFLPRMLECYSDYNSTIE